MAPEPTPAISPGAQPKQPDWMLKANGPCWTSLGNGFTSLHGEALLGGFSRRILTPFDFHVIGCVRGSCEVERTQGGSGCYRLGDTEHVTAWWVALICLSPS